MFDRSDHNITTGLFGLDIGNIYLSSIYYYNYHSYFNIQHVGIDMSYDSIIFREVFLFAITIETAMHIETKADLSNDSKPSMYLFNINSSFTL